MLGLVGQKCYGLAWLGFGGGLTIMLEVGLVFAGGYGWARVRLGVEWGKVNLGIEIRFGLGLLLGQGQGWICVRGRASLGLGEFRLGMH